MTEPPSDYPARTAFATDDAAARYAGPRFTAGSAAREARLIAALLARAGAPARVLDLPCGTGRLASLWPGAAYLGCDIARAMAAVTAAAGRAVVVGECERIPLRTGAVDLACCVRLLHHLPTDAHVTRCLVELARVARQFVLVSYFRPLALQHWRRVVRGWLRPDRPHRRARPWRTIREAAATAGLVPVAHRSHAPGISEHWFALFKHRIPPPGP